MDEIIDYKDKIKIKYDNFLIFKKKCEYIIQIKVMFLILRLPFRHFKANFNISNSKPDLNIYYPLIL